MGAPQSQALCGIQMQPPAPPWSILRRFLLHHAPPDYRTRAQSTCRAGAGAHGCLENGWSQRAGLSSDAILECRSEHRDRRCARSDLCGAAGFLNRAPLAATLTKNPLWGAAAAPFSPGPRLSINSKTYLARVCGLRYRRRMPGEVGTRFAPASRVTGEGAGGPAKMCQASRISRCANAFILLEVYQNPHPRPLPQLNVGEGTEPSRHCATALSSPQLCPLVVYRQSRSRGENYSDHVQTQAQAGKPVHHRLEWLRHCVTKPSQSFKREGGDPPSFRGTVAKPFQPVIFFFPKVSEKRTTGRGACPTV